MSASVQAITAALANSFAGSITLVPKGSIGSIVIQATLEERMTDTLEMTEQPLQVNAVATDHSFLRPQEVVLTCAWSNSGGSSSLLGSLGDAALAALDTISPFPLAASDLLANAANLKQVLSGISSGATFGSDTSADQAFTNDYVGSIYSQLVQLQQSRVPFSVYTTARSYPSMLLTELSVTRDRNTSLALMVQAVCKQLIFVDTEATTLAPQSQQANAASTAATVNVGNSPAVSATPANGGSVPPDEWTGE